ncbi:MAG TPA: hypothetical protein VFZ69_04760 [Longimicrobiales bacterium]
MAPRPSRPGSVIAWLVTLAAALSGCAPRSAVATGGALDTVLTVDNDLRVGASVYVLSGSGLRRGLGYIEAGAIIRYPRLLHAGAYRLVAEPAKAPAIVSETFRLNTDTTTVTWHLAENRLVLQ